VTLINWVQAGEFAIARNDIYGRADVTNRPLREIIIASGLNPDVDFLGFRAAGAITFAELLGLPTTLGGYGISDAYTKVENDALYLLKSGGTVTGNLNVNGLFNGADGSFGIDAPIVRTAAIQILQVRETLLLAPKAPTSIAIRNGWNLAAAPSGGNFLNQTGLAVTVDNLTTSVNAANGMYGASMSITHRVATIVSDMQGLSMSVTNNNAAGIATNIVGINFSGSNVGNCTTMIGGSALVQQYSTGTMTTAIALRARMIHQGTGLVTTIAGLRVVPLEGAGPNTNLYGLHIENLARTQSTNVFGLYVDGSTVNNAIAGKLGIGSLVAPTVPLEVTGLSKFTDDAEITTANRGLILKSTNGSRYRLTVSDTGAVVSTAVV